LASGSAFLPVLDEQKNGPEGHETAVHDEEENEHGDVQFAEFVLGLVVPVVVSERHDHVRQHCRTHLVEYFEYVQQS